MRVMAIVDADLVHPGESSDHEQTHQRRDTARHHHDEFLLVFQQRWFTPMPGLQLVNVLRKFELA
jgi:hypothetical protein